MMIVNSKKHQLLEWIDFRAFINDLKDVGVMILLYLYIICQYGPWKYLMDSEKIPDGSSRQ